MEGDALALGGRGRGGSCRGHGRLLCVVRRWLPHGGGSAAVQAAAAAGPTPHVGAEGEGEGARDDLLEGGLRRLLPLIRREVRVVVPRLPCGPGQEGCRRAKVEGRRGDPRPVERRDAQGGGGLLRVPGCRRCRCVGGGAGEVGCGCRPGCGNGGRGEDGGRARHNRRRIPGRVPRTAAHPGRGVPGRHSDAGFHCDGGHGKRGPHLCRGEGGVVPVRRVRRTPGRGCLRRVRHAVSRAVEVSVPLPSTRRPCSPGQSAAEPGACPHPNVWRSRCPRRLSWTLGRDATGRLGQEERSKGWTISRWTMDGSSSDGHCLPGPCGKASGGARGSLRRSSTSTRPGTGPITPRIAEHTPTHPHTHTHTHIHPNA